MKILWMRLENFQGVRSFSFEPQGHGCSIYGANGTGKTTVYNAFCWLLYGRPSTDEKSYTPQTAGTHGGEHGAEMAVEAGGEAVTLRKVYKEKEVKKRGGGVEYKRTTEHYIDGVPVKEKEYAAAVAKIAPEAQAKLLTRYNYFLEELPIKDRRKVLLDIGGGVEGAEVVASDEMLGEIPTMLAKDGGGTYTVEQYGKIVTERRKAATKEKADTVAMISEARRATPDTGGQNEEAVRERLSEAREKKAELERQAAALSETAEAGTRKRIAELEAEKAEIRAKHDAAQNEVKQQIRLLEARAAGHRENADAKARKAEMMRLERDSLIAEWIRLKAKYEAKQAEQWSGEAVCPTCGQAMPEEMVQERMAAWNVAKSDELERIHDRMDGIAESGKRVSLDEIERLRADAEELEKEAEKQDALAKKMMKGMALSHADFGGIDAEIATLRESMESLDTSAREAELSAEVAKLSAEIAGMESLLADFRLANQQAVRVAELEARESELNRTIEVAERAEWLLKRFEQRKAEMLESSINSRFETINFRLFREQQNGEIVPDCEAMLPCEGQGEPVPFRSANNARRINAGLELMDALGAYYKTEMPIWIDNCEGISHPRQTAAQQIRLYVSDADKDLRVEVDG